ncbi:hypothetical protein TWF506_008015 [Arthrobotrys conoides]|uniref:Piwi domain-containing protein n=1 Tax=Arthrobotrys conoides TaxID=74498 RepID=A0AAN8RX33_9PEZI
MFKRAQNSPTLSRFGLDFGNELLKIQARTLAMPTVLLGGDRTADISTNDGSLLGRDLRFQTPAAVLPFVLVQLTTGAENVQVSDKVDEEFMVFVQRLLRRCGDSGMTRPPGTRPEAMFLLSLGDRRDDPRNDIEGLFTRQIAPLKAKITSGQIPLIFCMLPNNDPKYYNAIKRAGDVLAGVLTICMDGTKLAKFANGKAADSYCNTLALKVNLKCGGVNHSTQSDPGLQGIFPGLKSNSVMLLGADVSHSGRRDLPSITAIVGTYEPSHSRPYSEISYQTNKEMIESMTEGVRNHLKRFHTMHRTLPRYIVMFRDGVSESQYRQVLDQEVVAIDVAIDRALQELGSGTAPERPKLMVLVVGKRHHTRFFPPGAKDDHQKTLPGLVVDRAVTAIYEKDFYLQAHGAIQGTPRPAHYFVVRDDMQLSDAQIQQLVFTWSFSFGRSFRSVSYAPPAYCADLACGRARAWIQHKVDDIRGGLNLYPASTGGSTTTTGGSADIRAAAVANLNGIARDCGNLHKDLEETMWYI